jgi:hypothetical protein
MCDRYSQEHGYICDSCFLELVELGDQQDIQQFLENEHAKKPTAAWNHFDDIFKRCDEEED